MARARLILLLLCLPALAGDKDVAQFLFKKGQKAYRAKEYGEAERFFRRALEEHTPFPEASYGHGQALEKLGRTQDAAHAYRVCIAAVDGLAEPPPGWKSAASRAGRALSRLRRRFAPLDRVNKEYVKKFLDLGKRTMESDPKWARRAFETVLAIDPAHSAAKAYLAKLAGPKKPEKPKAGWKELIQKGNLDAWDPGATANWSIDGKVITGDAVGRSGQINWLDKLAIEGEYTLRVRFRIKRDGGNRRTLGLFVGDGRDAWWAIMLDDDDSLALVRVTGGTNNEVRSRVVGDRGWSHWHALKLVVERADTYIFLDDKKVMEITVPRKQAFAGKVGLFIQNAKVEFKDLEMKR